MLDSEHIEVLDPLRRSTTISDGEADRIETRKSTGAGGMFPKRDDHTTDRFEGNTSNRPVGVVAELELHASAEDLLVPAPARVEVRHWELHVMDTDDLRLHGPSIRCSNTVSE